MHELHDIHPVTMREPITFHCTQCSECCRNIRDSVMLAPYDAFRLTRHLRRDHAEITIEDVLMQYCEPKPLSRGYVIYVLKTVDDSGVCGFLKDGKCSIYAARPRTCRLYPFSVGPGVVDSYMAWYLCTERKEHFNSGTTTAREWKYKSLPREEEDAILAEFRCIAQMGKLLRRIPETVIEHATLQSMLFAYAYYDLDEPFLPQYLRNMKELMQQLQRLA
ncbi:MAG: YkgJ family cysteine cluster protein [Oscillospiraceae bacterium]|nr:YkgJ family cysteine cluster protein [Oscillospiraceae bacterium]